VTASDLPFYAGQKYLEKRIAIANKLDHGALTKSNESHNAL
jgi:hypothetical protein